MSDTLKCITPVDGSVYVERPLADNGAIDRALARAREAQEDWRRVPIEERCALLTKAVDAFVAEGDAIAEEISWQMGRPLSHCPGEVGGFEERARHMLAIAPEVLGDIAVEPKEGFTRFVRPQALGADAALRGALHRSLREGRPAGGRVPAPASGPRGGTRPRRA
jgi:acyl-CoA reductase-like NAD-dependent aldehyde dehydrogenase